MSFPNHVRGLKRKALGREWGLRSAKAWKPRDPDYETIRKRALDDRRGTVLREGMTYHGDGRITKWHIRHSINGRTDQFDLVANGRVWLCSGPRKIPRDFRPNRAK